jgi:hypothetical protein
MENGMAENKVTAADILISGAEIIDQRGKQRDKPNGERSMALTVKMFNARYGADLTEAQGWAFMTCLKHARMAAGKFNEDDYIDAVNYEALHAECVINAQKA